MQMRQRGYHEQDLEGIEWLHGEARRGNALERYPTLWRLRQELHTRLWEPEKDASIWANSCGQIIAVAALVRKEASTTSWYLEYSIHPQVNQYRILEEILSWVDRRVEEKVISFSAPHMITIAQRKEDDALFFAHGYTLNHSSFNQYMRISLKTDVRLPTSVEGFTFRPLDGIDEFLAENLSL